MTIQDAYLPTLGYVTSQDEDPWESREKITEKFEIVGIYGDFSQDNSYNWWSSDSNILYIPDGCVPEHFGEQDETEILSFSFVLARPEFRDPFLAEMEEQLEPLGMVVSFLENNWDSFHAAAEGILWEARFSLVIFAIVLAVALVAVTFLYTWQRKKEIAIARALGVSAGKAALSAALPMLFWGLAGILAGEGAAWRYGLKQAEKTLEVLSDRSSVSLSLFWFAGIGLLVWLILMLAVLAGTWAGAHRPVLWSLQGSPAANRKKKSIGKAVPEAGSLALQAGKNQTDGRKLQAGKNRTYDCLPASGGQRPVAAGARFVVRHLCRFSQRSFFALLAAAVFVTASCWLRHSIVAGEQEADRLYQTTEVKAEIFKENAWLSGSIHGWTISKMLETGFIRDYYLEAVAACQIGLEDQKNTRQSMQLFGTTDFQQLLLDSGEKLEIQYAPGYEEELFDVDYEQVECCTVIVPKSLWEKWMLSGGEQIELLKVDETLGTVRYSIPVVVGGYHSGAMEGSVLAPISLVTWMDGSYITAQFTLDPERNREIESFRSTGQEVMETTGAVWRGLSLRILDSELKQAVEPLEKNIILMKILYPIANAVSFLAAVGLSILFLFQRRREAAILRILGMKTTQTRIILVLELLIVTLAGMLFGTGLTVFLAGRDGIAAIPLAAGCYFLGALAGTIAGSVWVTNGRPLELLQEKD